MTKKKFFEDHAGQKSSMRLMSMASLLAAILFSAVVVYKGDVSENIMVIIIFFLLSAFAPKAVQKFAENHQSQLIQGRK